MKPRLFASAAAFLFVCVGGAAAQSVRAWEEPLVLPTYLVGAAEPNPIFYFGRAYQGAKGPVYPYPFLDRLTDTRVDKTYRAVYLENEYVKICVLPEIGGRIFSAVDKTDNYDYVYRQHVIKPALIGMLGAWISGGVEWNIPHHHRATTFMPVDFAIVRNPDGSASVWVGEIELRHRMKWLVGLTLRPGRSALEVTTKVINRTPLAHGMLAFANVAIQANADYQVIFPPDVDVATFHGKNQFSRWPVSTEIFNRQDYTKGVDVSRWKNHAAPTSFFAWEAKGDFLAGYDHGRDAGVVFVADHNFVPGKKLWTWGTGNEGKLWERLLTDADGPYAELMVGAFSDNQPDYSWIAPYEVRTAGQWWYPLRRVGGVKAANENAACDLTLTDKGEARLGLCPTAVYPAVRANLRIEGKTVFEEVLSTGPDRPYVKTVALPSGVREDSLALAFVLPDGRELISYRPVAREKKPLPSPVTPPPAPKDIPTVEELYLAGSRLEQFYNPALEPYPYYEEALKRDPGDYRTNTALGLLYLKRAMYVRAEQHLRTAVERASINYTRPRDGEGLYYLGVALRALGRIPEARDALNRAAWNQAWRSASFYQLAELAGAAAESDRALRYADLSLDTNRGNPKALGLKAALLRRAGRTAEAAEVVGAARSADPLDFFAANEFYLLRNTGGLHEDVGQAYKNVLDLMRDSPANYLELAADYAGAGFWDNAAAVLSRLIGRKVKGASDYPLLYYYLAYASEQLGEKAKAQDVLGAAALMPPDYGFPFQSEFLEILRWARISNPKDARAPYYLGNFLFDLQPDAALEAWEASAALDPNFSISQRNLGLAYARVKNDVAKAVAFLEKAVAANPADPRLYLELDQLSEAGRVPAAKRLAVLEKNHPVVEMRDDALSREIQLLVLVGRYDRAIELLTKHHFHVWEGGGDIYGTFVDAHLFRGQKHLDAGNFRGALEDFRAALTYPANLDVREPTGGGGSGKVYFLIGSALERVGDKAGAKAAFEKAIAFRHGWSEASYYQGLAWNKLGRGADAQKAFDGLVRSGQERLKAAPAMDFFEKFGERQSALSQTAQAHFLAGLGYIGNGRPTDAAAEFGKAYEANPYHPGIKYFYERRGR
jgi:tetratricopeptide (TPR) repeat protein